MSMLLRPMLFVILATGILTPLVMAQEPPPPRMQRYAVLIGINRYKGGLGDLSFCHNDMHALKIRLLAAGFPPENVVFLNEADAAQDLNLLPSKANIESQLRLRMGIASKNDLVLVAFSGHGLHVGGKSYLCPLDANLDDAPGTMVAVDDIYEGLQSCQAAQKLLLVDACRNDPAKRAKAVRSADLTLGSPPTGVLVLSSCEAGQYSMEDPKLKHGVFMYYVSKGLEGAADSEADKNGKITLDELYNYAHEKTKIHVANAYGLPQKPMLEGKVVGRIELASVPDRTKLEQALADADRLAELAAKPAVDPGPASADSPTSIPPKSNQSATKDLTHALLNQGNLYYQQGDQENAINAFTALIEDTDQPAALRRLAREARSSAFLALGGRENCQRALTDQKAAGQETISLTVVKASENLMVSTNVVGTVKQNEVVQVGQINGDWLWVAAVNGNDKKQGYLKWDAVLRPAAAAPAAQGATATTSAQPVNGQAGVTRSVNQGYSQPQSGGGNSGNTPGLNGQYRLLDQQENKYDRMENRNASNGALRAQERKIESTERRIDRSESRGGGGRSGGGGRGR